MAKFNVLDLSVTALIGCPRQVNNGSPHVSNWNHFSTIIGHLHSVCVSDTCSVQALREFFSFYSLDHWVHPIATKVASFFEKRKPWTMRNVVGMASVASKWKNSAFEHDSCPRVMGEEERGVHILLRCLQFQE